jgi:hypothetical protein
LATKLKDLKITSTDLVDRGANPDAFVRLFKRRGKPAKVKKDGAATFNENMTQERLRELSGEAWSCSYAFSDSLASIICDGDLDEDVKLDMMFTSLDEFAETIRNAAPQWAAGNCAKGSDVKKLKKAAEPQATFEIYWGSVHKAADKSPEDHPEDTPGEDDKPDKNIQKKRRKQTQ